MRSNRRISISIPKTTRGGIICWILHWLFLTSLWNDLIVFGFLSSSSSSSSSSSPITTKVICPSSKRIERKTCLFEQQLDNDTSQQQQPGTARFTGIETSKKSDEITNVFDYVLSVVASDIVSIGLGIIGLFIVVGHRLSNLDIDANEYQLAQQTRLDLLAGFACGSVLLNGISKLDVTSVLSETVILDGISLSEPEGSIIDTNDNDDNTISWALESLLTATPAATAILVTGTKIDDNNNWDWTVTGRAGIVPSTEVPVPSSTPILDRIAKIAHEKQQQQNKQVKETYLPTLQALPGRFEFTYLPSNAQLALLIPLIRTDTNDVTILVVGSDTAKSFSPRDVAWCQVIAQRMGET